MCHVTELIWVKPQTSVFRGFVARGFNARYFFSFYLLSLLYPRSNQIYHLYLFLRGKFFSRSPTEYVTLLIINVWGDSNKISHTVHAQGFAPVLLFPYNKDLSYQGLADIFRAKQTLVLAYQLQGFTPVILASEIPLFSWQVMYTLRNMSSIFHAASLGLRSPKILGCHIFVKLPELDTSV